MTYFYCFAAGMGITMAGVYFGGNEQQFKNICSFTCFLMTCGLLGSAIADYEKNTQT